MKALELTKLIEGLLVVIGLAVVVGKYDALDRFARRQAVHALRGWDTHYFFPASQRTLSRAPQAAPGNR